jgi:DNA ligase (NAD+)
MSLTYEGGQLAFAATRGSGNVGDDVTHNVRTIAAIPLKLKTDDPPKIFEARGEVYMTRSELARINAAQAANNGDPYKNARNLAAGTLKLLDPRECAKRKLSFFAYGSGNIDGLKIAKPVRDARQAQGVRVPGQPARAPLLHHRRGYAYCREWDAKRKELPYDTDGIVVKVNDWAQRERIGYTAKVPKWARAFKFEAEQASTKLGDVVFHIGKFGELTPVATFDPPVNLAGTTVTHASMHNASWVAEMDVRIGDTVVVEKKGEIIPQVVEVITADRTGAERVVVWPENCPECGAPVRKEESATSYNFVCSNPEACSGGMWKRLEGYARKTRMDIDGLGREVAVQLVEAGLVKSVADLYRLTKEQLLALEGFKDKKAQKLLDGIAASKTRGLGRLLPGLAIYSVGEKMAEDLVEEFPDIDLLVAATPDDIARVRGWGPERAKYLRAFLDSDNGKTLIAELRAAGVKMTHDKKAAPAGGLPLAGMTICVTGTLEHYDRVGIETTIKQYGGKPSGSVSKKTSFLLLGTLPKPSSKHEDAKKLGVKIVDEAEFRRLIGEG